MTSRDEQREQTRRRLYDAALAVFRRDGVANSRIDDISSAVGVSRGTFYFHFPTKEHVLLARMRETEEEILAEVAKLPDDAPLSDVLATVNREMARIWEADPALLAEVAGHALRHTAENMSDREATALRADMSVRFQRAADAGEIAVPLHGETLGDLYLGNILGGLLAWYASRSMPLNTVLDGVTWLFWNGVKAS